MKSDSVFIRAVANLAFAEGAEKVEAFAAALERGDLHLKSTTGDLQANLHVPHARVRHFRKVLQASSTIEGLVMALRIGGATQEQMSEDQPTIEVVWTYPGRARPGLRSTAAVAREIIGSSQRSLVVVGYAVTVDPAMVGLAAQTIDAMAQAAERGVQVTVVLHRDANRRALLTAWRGGAPLPKVFTWPSSDDDMASVHAKLLISDRSEGLVTSANLTYHGLERNLEMGLRITGSAAAEIDDRVHELIASGEFVLWEDER